MRSTCTTCTFAALLLVLLLPGCGSTPRWLTRPEHTETTRDIYVPIPERLTRQHETWPEPFTISQCPDIAAKRRRELEQCNADKLETSTIEGTKVDD